MLRMGSVQEVEKMEEEVAKMLKQVRKVVEQEQAEENKKEEAKGIPKPSFLANLVAIQQLHNMPECPAPKKKKKAKKTVRFFLSTVSKRKLQMEEEVEMSSLKRVKEESLLAEELEQIGFMMRNLLPNGKT